MAFKKTNLAPVINHLRQRLEAIGEAINTFERISQEYLDKKAPRASIRNPELAVWFRLEPARLEASGTTGKVYSATSG
jgi:hypothetical protein